MGQDNLRELITSLLPEGTDFDQFVSEVKNTIENLPVEEREELLVQDVAEAELEARAVLARKDTPDGFAHYCFCVTGMELPAHAFYRWIVPQYFVHGVISLEEAAKYYERPGAEPHADMLVQLQLASEEEDMIGVVLYAAREMAKTTYNTILWTSFRIGQEPHRANMIVQIGDTSAKRNAQKVADIIDGYKGFRKVFPHVKPNKDKSWSANGYEVIDTSMSEDDWNTLNSTRQDVTLAGYGYNSGVVIGKHPDGVLIIDDILNENNTQSQVELDMVLKIVQGTIFYAATDTTWVTFVGTPWITGDVLDFVAATKQYLVSRTPAYFEIINGQYKIADKFNPETEKVYLWPEMRGERWVRRKVNGTIESEFKRMVLLTISTADRQLYTYTKFPYTQIDWSWKQRTGVDPVATVKLVQGVEAGVSNFAMVHALETPYRQILIADAKIEKIDMEEGEREVIAWQRRFPRCRFSIETNNAGAAFISMINRSPGMLWDGHNTAEIGKGSKEDRQYKFLQPLLKNNVVIISDADTPGMRIVRNYLDKFGLFRFAPDAPELDAGDAIVLAVFAFPEIWYSWVNYPQQKDILAQAKENEEQDSIIKMVELLNRSRR